MNVTCVEKERLVGYFKSAEEQEPVMFVKTAEESGEKTSSKALAAVGTSLSSAPLTASLSRRSGSVPGVTSPAFWLKDRAERHGPMRWFQTLGMASSSLGVQKAAPRPPDVSWPLGVTLVPDDTICASPALESPPTVKTNGEIRKGGGGERRNPVQSPSESAQ